jgi:Myb-like DNA-binding protein
MTGAARRGSNWTPDEDQRLLKLVETGKSWVFISANLNRPAKTARDRLAYLERQAIKAEFQTGPAEHGQKG